MLDSDMKRAIVLSSFFCSFPILFFITEQLTQTSFSYFGIFPRTLHGLLGVIFSPLLHSGLEHLTANILPLWLALFGLFHLYPKASLSVLFSNALFCSLLVWLFARPNFHIGASGVLYGINAFLLFSGFIRWEKSALTFALVVLVLNQGIVFGMLPVNPEVSYESHIAGFLTGLLQAFWFKNYDIRQKNEIQTIEDDNDDENGAWNYKPFTIEGKEEN